ncbi:MAG: hypothetical protein MUF51_05525 [Vicinamibacteria bacterium]|jgi:hypothetical protein|nr:hypothetical protein [Vicinamibacteria bacterium]
MLQLNRRNRSRLRIGSMSVIVCAASILFSASLTAAGTSGPAAQVPQQKPLIVIGDTFQWVYGSWAKYTILDKAKNETSQMTMAILDRGKKKDKAGIWMEIEMQVPDAPLVVTRILAEDRKGGPGDVLECIIQVAGMEPAFSVPGSFLKQGNDEGGKMVTQFKPAQEVKKVQERKQVYRGREIALWDVEALDGEGQPLKAIVSIEVPPIGVVLADTSETRMELVDWGLGARSRIQGKPLNFYLWIAKQVQKGMAQ